MRSLTFTHTIGAGAFGTVYKADLTTDQGFRRQVAVKVILADHAEKEMFITRMRDEARLLGLLQGDHILKVIDLLSVNERDAIIMEYIEGIDLADAIKSEQLPPFRAVMEIGAMVAGTLDRAHAAQHPHSGEDLGVVHRDVKPANVMITASGNLKLLDFGIAQARFAARESQTGQMVLGTLNYMAPDYIISGEVTPAIDVYGLGLTLYELVTAEVYGQPTLREDRHNQRLAERLELIGDEPTELKRLIERMLHWDPESRPSCSECEQALLMIADETRGPGLRRYAAEIVPAQLAARTPQPDRERLLGKTLRLGEAVIPEVENEEAAKGDPTNQAAARAQPPSASGRRPVRTQGNGTVQSEDAPTAIGDRSDVARSLERHTAETAKPLPPALPTKNVAHPTTDAPSNPPRSDLSSVLRGVLIGSAVGLLAVGCLGIVLFYLFPPTDLP